MKLAGRSKHSTQPCALIHHPDLSPRPWGSQPWRSPTFPSSFTAHGEPETPGPPSPQGLKPLLDAPSQANNTPRTPPLAPNPYRPLFSAHPHSPRPGPLSYGHPTPPRSVLLMAPTARAGPRCHHGPRFPPGPLPLTAPTPVPASPGGAAGGPQVAPCPRRPRAPAGRWRRVCGVVTAKPRAAARLNELFAEECDTSGFMSISLKKKKIGRSSRNALAQLPRYPWADL